MKAPTAIIVGAGPAGLTAAYELLVRTDIHPVVLEASHQFGGISRTVVHNGNRIDIGGHRFFSKSDRIMDWWQKILPLQGAPARDDLLLGRKLPLSPDPEAPDPEGADDVMLVRSRLSRIFFLRKFFDYPVSLNASTISNLGISRMMKIGLSYAGVRFFPIREEKTLEDFFINRFGRELYGTFFKDYTEKVWGVPCNRIPAEWGAQRVKGLSVSKALLHALRSMGNRKDRSIGQKDVETTLIGQFLYPKYGPGQMWEAVASAVTEKGGEIHAGETVTGIRPAGQEHYEIKTRMQSTGEERTYSGKYVFSTMPVRDLIRALEVPVPPEVEAVGEGLVYRDFMTVGLLLKRLNIRNESGIPTVNGIIPDNWIYVQERDVRLGRIQVFNNWSPYLVRDPDTVWIGLEYFCNEGDDLWNKPDGEMARFAIEEMERIHMVRRDDVLDHVVIRMPKTYPAYFGSYEQFSLIREYTDTLENLFLVGRNGMHRYNNMDHSMLASMTAVDNIVSGRRSKENIWAVNTEEEYHESK